MSKTGPKTILVVNDKRLEMATLVQILLHNGYQLLYAEGKSQAIKAVKQAKPDLVICDTGSTNLDLAAYFKTVRSTPSTRRIPFLFITDPAGELPEQISELHPHHVLPKPFTREQLAITVQKSIKNLSPK
jgi:CheY-like chemotaxis protein